MSRVIIFVLIAIVAISAYLAVSIVVNEYNSINNTEDICHCEDVIEDYPDSRYKSIIWTTNCNDTFLTAIDSSGNIQTYTKPCTFFNIIKEKKIVRPKRKGE